GPRNHIGGADAHTRFETASKRASDPPLSTCHTVRSVEDRTEQETNLTYFVPPTPHDTPLLGGHTPRSDEGRPNINELMNLCTQLSNRVLALEQFQTAQDLMIKRERTPGMQLFQIGTSKKKTLDKENVSKQGRDKSNRTEELNLSDKDIFKDEMTTMDDTLMAIKRTRQRTTTVVIHDVEEEPRRATPPLTVQIQDKDTLLAVRLQQEEREQFIVDEQARMLVDLIAERKREQKWINDFIHMDSEEVSDTEQQVKGSKKRSRVDHDQESVKKQKLDKDDAEKEELRACLDIVPVDDIANEVESLATKYLIVDWKTHTLIVHMMYYQIIRANGSSKNYKILFKMCDDFDRHDIMDLYRMEKVRLQPSGGYNVVPPPIIGNFMPPKPNLVFHTASIAVETDHFAFTIKLSPSEPTQDLSHTTRPTSPIIEDWVSNTEA
nr:hypothetical protein [Tanacetum cinerariifolium]